MKLLRKLSLLSLSLLFTLGLGAQGIEFFHGSWEEALAKASAEDKLIFVDAYASWCGPCKKMAANVFPQKEVGDYFNKNFISVKYDMEKAESTEFRKTHSVRAFPTLFFINGKNEVVHKTVGGKQVKTLLTEASSALGKMDDVPAMAADWEAGNHSSKLAFRYIRALVRQGEPHAKITNDYLRSQKDLTTEDNLNILLTAATTADSRIFDLLVKNQAAVVALAGQDAFTDQVERAVMATKNKALEYKDASLLATAVKKFSTVDPVGSKRLALSGAYELAAKGNDLKAFKKAAKKYLTKGVEDDPVRLEEFHKTAAASRFIEDDQVMEMVIDAAARSAAADTQTGFRKYYRLADFLLKKGKTTEALTYAQKAMEALTSPQPNYERAIKGLIQRIEEAR